jgi:GxxExxY protein
MKHDLIDLEYQVTSAAIEVHRNIGPGLLEKVYQQCLEYELKQRGIHFQAQMVVPVIYQGLQLNAEIRADFFIENLIVLEIKAVEDILPIHKAQVITYMNLLQAPKGLIINFNSVNIVRNGKMSFVNEYYRKDT